MVGHTARSRKVGTNRIVDVTSPVPGSATILEFGADTHQIAAVVRDFAGTIVPGAPLTYSSSNTAVATVSGTGLVTPQGTGTVWITVRHTDAVVATVDFRCGRRSTEQPSRMIAMTLTKMQRPGEQRVVSLVPKGVTHTMGHSAAIDTDLTHANPELWTEPLGYPLDPQGRPFSWQFDDTYPTSPQGVWMRHSLDAMYDSVEGFTIVMGVNIDAKYLAASPVGRWNFLSGVDAGTPPSVACLDLYIGGLGGVFGEPGQITMRLLAAAGQPQLRCRTPANFATAGKHVLGFRYNRQEPDELLRGRFFWDGVAVTQSENLKTGGAGAIEPLMKCRDPWYIGGYTYAVDGILGEDMVVPAKEVGTPCIWDTTLTDVQIATVSAAHAGAGWS